MDDIYNTPDDTPPAEPADSHRPYSPPCFMREVDPAYAGYLTRAELIELLNELLEGERAGAKASTRWLTEGNEENVHSALRRIAVDEWQFCGMLSRHIRALGATPSLATGPFYEKLMAIPDLPKRLAFLNRGQGWVVRRLRDALPCVQDDRLYEDLKVMLQVHEANIGRCERLLKIEPPRSGASGASHI
jgi:nitronate monooxygenase